MSSPDRSQHVQVQTQDARHADRSVKDGSASTDASRTLSTNRLMPQDEHERALRPHSFQEFVGQKRLRDNLETFIAAALARDQPLDHVLLSGPPGLGKTSCAHIIARSLGAGLHITSGPAIARVGELAALLTNLKPKSVLFIDEVHRLPKAVEEVLYTALEDYKLDLVVGEGPAARSVRLNLAPFTLVAATTRSGLLSRPLRDRFGILEQLSFYTAGELSEVIGRAATTLSIEVAKPAAQALAARARGTPRIALRLLRRVQDFATVADKPHVDAPFVDKVLGALGVDALGLDRLDQRYLEHLAHHFSGGPVGIETLAAALFEERATLEDVVEPFLIQQGLLQRTSRGRVLACAAYAHLGLPAPAQSSGKE